MASLRSIAGAQQRPFAPAAPVADTEPEDEPEDDERHLACLQACLDRLPAAERRMVLLAHRGDERERAQARRRLAGELGIPADELRLRVHRLRCRLADCCARCMTASTNGGSHHDDEG